MQMTSENILAFREKILNWYDEHRRVLPWRALAGESPDPYKVWLSEIMLQQTTVQAVIPYFLRFIEKWPAIDALAFAPSDDLMQEWAGLGYYARARNLHKCAKIIVDEYGGHFPKEQGALKELPGIGDYTSAAIMAIAFNLPATVVDGNVERVMARYFGVMVELPKAKPELKGLANELSFNQVVRPGDYAQALMDIGSGVCTPKSPLCASCPLNDGCKAYENGMADILPLRAKKEIKPERVGNVYWVENDRGEVLVHKRPEKGLLGGMYGFPTSAWEDSVYFNDSENEKFLSVQADPLEEKVQHVFTHFNLTLSVYSARVYKGADLGISYFWVGREDVVDLKFPTVFEKVKKLCLTL